MTFPPAIKYMVDFKDHLRLFSSSEASGRMKRSRQKFLPMMRAEKKSFSKDPIQFDLMEG